VLESRLPSGLPCHSHWHFDWLETGDSVVSDERHAVTNTRPSIALDGIFFQFRDPSGIARVWSSLLREWSGTAFGDSLLVIDRDEAAPKFPGITYVPFKSYESRFAAQASFELEDICSQHHVKLFVSSFYSMPLETPSVAMVHDTITEQFPGSERKWVTEKRYTTNHARAHIAVSNRTSDDIYETYPVTRGLPLSVAHNGVDDAFCPVPPDMVRAFKQRHGINKQYFLTVGRRDKHKNARLFFEAFSQLPGAEDMAIICCGGSPHLEAELSVLAGDRDVFMLSLSDADLNAAYAGALALVYPSLYEGFGLPIIEAMASGCPVITCRNGSIPEVAGEAAYFVDDANVSEMIEALVKIQRPDQRQTLINAGLQQASLFSWKTTAKTVGSFLTTMAARDYSLPELRRERSDRLWRELRTAELQFESMSPRLQQLLQRPELLAHEIHPTAEANQMERVHLAWLQALAEENSRSNAAGIASK
jgi:glycosyltransferase involved in cell wall biosynthesis